MIYHAPRARDGYLCCSLHMIMQQFSMQDCKLSNTTIHQPALLQVKIGHPLERRLRRYRIEPCESFKHRYCKYWYLVLYHPSQTMLPGTWSEDLERNFPQQKHILYHKKKSVHYNFKTNTRKSETATNTSCWTCIYTCCLACIIVYSWGPAAFAIEN